MASLRAGLVTKSRFWIKRFLRRSCGEFTSGCRSKELIKILEKQIGPKSIELLAA